MHISRRGQEIQASPLRRLKPFADKALERGIHVYFLNIGDPDIPTPQPVMDVFHNFHDPVLSYGPAQGLPELRQAISDYFRHYRLSISADDVFITVGGSEAIFFALSVIADAGEEVIIPEPFYTNYNGFASFAGVKIVPLTLSVEDGFRLPPQKEIEARITPRTRAILLCSPNNPTGTVYTAEELERVVELVKKHDLFLIGDEVYKEFVYDGGTHRSVLEYVDIKDRVIVTDSISKRFSCCGARVGAVVTRNHDVYQSVLKFGMARLCPPSLEQKAAVAAYRMDWGYFETVRAEYERRRDVLYGALSGVPGLVMHKPQGAFYVIVRLPVKNAEHFVTWMLSDFEVDKETVMVAPADGFYSTPGRGKDEVRIAYILNERDLMRAMEILKAGLKKYRSLFP